MMIPVLLGILTGYWINYLADVLPDCQRLGIPRCQNQACRAPYSWKDYLLIRRCLNCGQPRRMRAFLVFVLALSSSLYIWFSPPARLGYALGLLILTCLVLIAVVDIEHRLLLRPLSIIGVLLAALAGFALHGWQSTAIGAVLGFSVMLVFYLLGTRVTRWIAEKKGRKPGEAEEALGSGDVTLSAILGLFLGSPLIWLGLLMGGLLLGVTIIPLACILYFKRRSDPHALMYIPLGWPFILGAILLVYFSAWITVLLAWVTYGN
jgi:prepilin signal peptidase PulO-like enzyme (type II secretory pathway)